MSKIPRFSLIFWLFLPNYKNKYWKYSSLTFQKYKIYSNCYPKPPTFYKIKEFSCIHTQKKIKSAHHKKINTLWHYVHWTESKLIQLGLQFTSGSHYFHTYKYTIIYYYRIIQNESSDALSLSVIWYYTTWLLLWRYFKDTIYTYVGTTIINNHNGAKKLIETITTDMHGINLKYYYFNLYICL